MSKGKIKILKEYKNGRLGLYGNLLSLVEK